MSRSRANSSSLFKGSSSTTTTSNNSRAARLRRQQVVPNISQKVRKTTGIIRKRFLTSLELVPQTLLSKAGGKIISLQGKGDSYTSYFMSGDNGSLMATSISANNPVNSDLRAELLSDIQQMAEQHPELFPGGQNMPGTLVIQTNNTTADRLLAHNLAARLLEDQQASNPGAGRLRILNSDRTDTGDLSTFTFLIGDATDFAGPQGRPPPPTFSPTPPPVEISNNNDDDNDDDPRNQGGLKGLAARITYARRRKRDKQASTALQDLDTGTASTVFSVTTNGPIGRSGTNRGFAKRAIQVGEPANATTYNLGHPETSGVPLTAPPNLIARQVISHRLDRELDIGVVVAEIFSKDGQDRTIGISAEVNAVQVSVKLPDPNDDTQTRDHFNYIDVVNAQTQKGLSDLQLMDALTGQLDRHVGNIFVDRNTGQVFGIDNDMAFPIDAAYQPGDNTLLDQFKRDAKGTLAYRQSLVDETTAEKVLNMTEADFQSVLSGRKKDPESLEPIAIGFAVERFNAVKARLQELKNNGKLVKEWNEQTFVEALESGFYETDPEITRVKVQKNYLARIAVKYDFAGNADQSGLVQQPAGEVAVFDP